MKLILPDVDQTPLLREPPAGARLSRTLPGGGFAPKISGNRPAKAREIVTLNERREAAFATVS